jgi:hypothetical protein
MLRQLRICVRSAFVLLRPVGLQRPAWVWHGKLVSERLRVRVHHHLRYRAARLWHAGGPLWQNRPPERMQVGLRRPFMRERSSLLRAARRPL